MLTIGFEDGGAGFLLAGLLDFFGPLLFFVGPAAGCDCAWAAGFFFFFFFLFFLVRLSPAGCWFSWGWFAADWSSFVSFGFFLTGSDCSPTESFLGLMLPSDSWVMLGCLFFLFLPVWGSLVSLMGVPLVGTSATCSALICSSEGSIWTFVLGFFCFFVASGSSCWLQLERHC